MKTNLLKFAAIMLVLSGGFGACQRNNEEGQPLSKEQISSNLSKNGSNDTTLLIGEWDCVKYAYTADGNNISDVAEISFYNDFGQPHDIRLEIPDTCRENLQGGCSWFFHCLTLFRVDYSIYSENLINLALFQIEYVYIDSPQLEKLISDLCNAYSFVIRDDEFIIHFTGAKNKNLIIFKKHIEP